jgi:hypothetical protein
VWVDNLKLGAHCITLDVADHLKLLYADHLCLLNDSAPCSYAPTHQVPARQLRCPSFRCIACTVSLVLKGVKPWPSLWHVLVSFWHPCSMQAFMSSVFPGLLPLLAAPSLMRHLPSTGASPPRGSLQSDSVVSLLARVTQMSL